MAKLILLIGGFIKEKDEFSKQLEGVHLDKNKIINAIVGKQESLYGEDLVNQIIQKSALYHLEKKQDVIINNLFFSKKSRQAFTTMAKKLHCEVDVYWFDMSAKFLSRAKISEEDITMFSKLQDIPTLDEGIQSLRRFSDKDFT